MNKIDPRSVAVKKYFKVTPDAPTYIGSILWVASGIFGLVLGIANGEFLLVLCGGGGLLLVGWGLFQYFADKGAYDKAYSEAEPKPSDQQMDNWLEQDKQRIVSEALNKLGLVPEQVLNITDPLFVIGPLSSAKFKLGNDNIVRFSAYQLVVIYLTNYHLGAYSCTLDFVDGRTGSEQTQEFHYNDVVSVSTLNSNSQFTIMTVEGEVLPIASQQQFSLSVASSESIKVTVAFPQVESLFKQGKLLPTGSEKAISTLRTMLREKKGGISGHQVG